MRVLAKSEHLQVAYGPVRAVSDVSFQIYEGEILAMIGPNGSGKTSTVECLEGLRKPTAGRVEILGQDPSQGRSALYQKLGIQLQEAEYPDKIKVKELCRLYSSFYKKPADWKMLLELLGLAEKAERTVKKLSGGEKQLLSILLALLPQPKLLILDELTTGLDPEARHWMWESLLDIRRCGTSILLVSHYLDEVERLADRLVYLQEGRSVFTGTQDEFRRLAKTIVSEETWKEALTLEEIYLLLSPNRRTPQWEASRGK